KTDLVEPDLECGAQNGGPPPEIQPVDDRPPCDPVSRLMVMQQLNTFFHFLKGTGDIPDLIVDLLIAVQRHNDVVYPSGQLLCMTADRQPRRQQGDPDILPLQYRAKPE